MARNSAFRPLSGKLASRDLSVPTENVARRVLVDPGDYPACVRKAHLIEPRNDGNVSVVLELSHPESGDYYDLRPLWVAGRNADRGTMAGRNVAIVQDLLEVIGIAPDSYKALTDTLLGRLVGRTFELTLATDHGVRGGTFNIITIVLGTVDPADVVRFPNPAAN
jgi:hypothetical protein